MIPFDGKVILHAFISAYRTQLLLATVSEMSNIWSSLLYQNQMKIPK